MSVSAEVRLTSCKSVCQAAVMNCLLLKGKQTISDNLQGVYRPTCVIRQMRYLTRSNVIKGKHFKLSGAQCLRTQALQLRPDLVVLQPGPHRSHQQPFWQ